ncbi:MAG: VanW family protein [Chitinophagales bacterium]
MIKKYMYFLFGLVFIAIILFGTINHAEKLNRPNLQVETTKQREKHSLAVDQPVVSGAVSALPWEQNKKFLTMQKSNQVPILMAAFCTVLRDPLPGEENNVHHAASLLAGTVVKPGEVFSQNTTIGPYSQARGFQKGPVYLGTRVSTTIGGGVCKIASTLYNVAILSNFPIQERHFHSMPVPYVPLGQDATVCYGAKDFKFMNNTDHPIMIWAQGVENRLYMGFYGQSRPPRVVWRHEIVKSVKSYTTYQTNWALPIGQERKVLEGMDGAIVNSWVDIHFPNGSVQSKFLGKSSYSPMPSVVEKGGKNW